MKLPLRMLLAVVLAAGAVAAARAGATQAPPPAEAPAVEEDLREFVPSEEIPADSSVSFPSDI
jgi:hypothetical protein